VVFAEKRLRSPGGPRCGKASPAALHRRALTEHELAPIYAAACTSGNDVVLDTLLLRLNIETAVRRGGLLGVHLADLDPELCVTLFVPALAVTEGSPIFELAIPREVFTRYRDGFPDPWYKLEKDRRAERVKCLISSRTHSPLLESQRPLCRCDCLLWVVVVTLLQYSLK
jgi:integrase